VGKTHLLSRYIKGSLPKNKFPTIGVEFATKPVPLKTGGTVKAQIWDTGKFIQKKLRLMGFEGRGSVSQEDFLVIKLGIFIDLCL